MNHSVMILELFLLALLARHAYRRPEPDEMELAKSTGKTAQDNAGFQITDENNAVSYRPAETGQGDDPNGSIQANNKKDLGPDLGIRGKYSTNDNVTFTHSTGVYL